jgi:predicted permease
MTLAVPPVLGRVFTSEDDQPGNHRVAVISYRFWQRRFAGDTNVLSRTLFLDGETLTIIGVMPPGFGQRLCSSVDVWKPFGWTAEERDNRGSHWLTEIDRLKPGVSIRQAQAEMNALAASLAKAFPDVNAGIGLRVVALLESTTEGTGRRVLWLAFGLTAFVLFIACANLANLQLARIVTRARELAVRAALGAGRGRLAWEVMKESLALSLVGGGAGILLALITNRMLSRYISGIVEETLNLPLNAMVLLFALGCAVLTTLLFGTAPACLATRVDVNSALKQYSRGSTAGRRHHRLRQALIVGEVALALVLVSGAGLFIRGLARLHQLDPGWQMDNLLTAQLALSSGKYESRNARDNFVRELEERLTTLPGVRKAGLSAMTPFWGFSSRYLGVEGRPVPPAGQYPLIYYETVSPGYFDAMGMVLKEGRPFNAQDNTNRPPVVIINESMARHFWPNQSALGKRINDGDYSEPWQEIVGVVNDIRFPAKFGSADTPFQTYRPLAQMSQRWLGMELRIGGAAEPVATAVRRMVGEIDPELSVVEMRLARETLSRSLGSVALMGRLLGAFAVLGVVLAAVGIYGVISYSVAQRTSEFGLRMALGAQRSGVLWLVIKQGCVLSVAGILLGLGGALAVARVLMSAAPEIPTRDPGMIMLLAVLLIVIAIIACWIPARRATQVNPMEVMRGDI